jgi:glycosyltransferase involved in cell wall biosynthesis
MGDLRLASIIICSYNYERYLKESIDSALSQTYPHIEVIVVDDGSTDSSREIIASYGKRIIPLLKENGGQDSAINAGFALSKGEVVCFLDSDDRLAPSAIRKAMECFRDPGVVKVQWPLWEIDEHSAKTGRVIPGSAVAEGNLRKVILREGPQSYVYPPTSGNAYARRFLERVLPLAKMELKAGTDDDQFAMLAPLFGRIKALKPQGFYRVHGRNSYWGKQVEHLATLLRDHERYCGVLLQFCRELRIEVDPSAWKKNSWFYRLHLALQEIATVVPPGETFILADQDDWGVGATVAGRRRFPFLDQDGCYWGSPPDDATAIQELERLRRAGANFLVFAWPAFWWLDHYVGMRRHLHARFRCVLRNERLILFDLRAAMRSSPTNGKAPKQRVATGRRSRERCHSRSHA